MVLDTIAQFGMVIFGITAIILVARKNKWGFVIGLISQPFFLITAIINNQEGLIVLSTVYSGIWIYGIYEWFFKNK